MTLEKIAKEQVICKLLFIKRTKQQNEECYKLLMEYQTKYNHPFPISVFDKYIEQIK